MSKVRILLVLTTHCDMTDYLEIWSFFVMPQKYHGVT